MENNLKIMVNKHNQNTTKEIKRINKFRTEECNTWIKNLLEGFNRRFDQVQERIYKLKNKSL